MRYFVFVLVGVLRRLLPLLILGLLTLFFWDDFATADWASILGLVKSISPHKWAVALCATAASFWCLAQYDVLAHRVINTGTPDRDARYGGGCAVGISQCTGFGPFVAAAVRFRILSDTSPIQIVAITAWVSTYFLLSWFIVATCIALPIHAGFGWMALPISAIVLVGIGAILIASPDIVVKGREFKLPSLTIGFQMLALAFADLACASLALWVLLPDSSAISFIAVFATYILALGAGLISSTPGGAGPFEMILLTALPWAENDTAVAGILAFRIVYYVLPGLISTCFCFFFKPSKVQKPMQALNRFTKFDIVHPEHAIVLQSDALLFQTESGSAPLLQTRNCMTVFRSMVRGEIADILPQFKKAARSNNRIPNLYKIHAKDAVRARQAGWTVLQMAREAYVNSTEFSVLGSKKRQLRRMLRKAEQAGITTKLLQDPDWDVMETIHKDWCDSCGSEQGLTMGRFDRHYLSDKILFGAWKNGQLMAFASCVDTKDALSLDIIRRRHDCPPGTMHALIVEMIHAAKEEEIPEVCLAAVPSLHLRRFSKNAADLERFKQCFAPKWRPLYFAAPNYWQLALATLDLRYNIIRPPSVTRPIPHPAGTCDWQIPDTAPAAKVETPRRAG